MAKAKRTTARTPKRDARQRARQRLANIDGKVLRKESRTSTLPHAAAWTPEVQELVAANAINVARDIIARPDVYGLHAVHRLSDSLMSVVETDLHLLIRHAFSAGFALAMSRHRHNLETTADAAVVVAGQRRGHEQGHAAQARIAATKAQAIRDKWSVMEAAGENVTNDAVVAALAKDGVKVSRRTVQRAFASKPPRRETH